MFTDGSSLRDHNKKKIAGAGIATWDLERCLMITMADGTATNNAAEIKAVEKAIEIAIEMIKLEPDISKNKQVIIHSDS